MIIKRAPPIFPSRNFQKIFRSLGRSVAAALLPLFLIAEDAHKEPNDT